MRAAIYSRVSSESQVEGFSLEAQYHQLIKYVDLQGWELSKVYTDPGVSAKSLKRPGIQEMIADMKAGKFEALIIHKLDRLTRNIADLCDLVDMVVKYNVKLISLSEQLETSTPMGLMFIRMLGVLAQMFRENLGEEIVKGQSMRASKGLRVSAARPFGYNLGDNLAMIVNEEEADTVRQIFAWYNEGINILTIVARLNKLPEQKKFYDITVRRILSNPTYIGVNHWKRKGATEGHYIEGAHEAIIDEDTFQAAQEITQKRNDKFLSGTMSDFCFSTVVKCGVCGRSMVGRTRHDNSKPQMSYRCAGKDRFSCKVGTIANKTLTNLFLQFITDFKFTAVEPQKVIAGRDIVKEKKKLEKQLAESNTTRKNYSRAMGSGKMEYDIFIELMEEENKKCEEWKSALDEINQMSPQHKKTRKDILELLDNLKTEWGRMSELQRKMNISKLFKFIVIKKEDDEWKIVAYKTNE